eukprot:gnl/Hemi2/17242_TR5744_c0_g1_i1.p1 gnl/Hemi2/17242_TR5744_c0_g1~~gnl/Hemi2/17242_TR5744_c0_g1_i1.p1  ORF type:complete len:364 (-),score=42.68 gnl/Hemi2/17242_TR5744_c0_g1_i1:44-1135(-)
MQLITGCSDELAGWWPAFAEELPDRLVAANSKAAPCDTLVDMGAKACQKAASLCIQALNLSHPPYLNADPENRPSWWPTSAPFKNPCYLTLQQAADVLEAVIQRAVDGGHLAVLRQKISTAGLQPTPRATLLAVLSKREQQSLLRAVEPSPTAPSAARQVLLATVPLPTPVLPLPPTATPPSTPQPGHVATATATQTLPASAAHCSLPTQSPRQSLSTPSSTTLSFSAPPLLSVSLQQPCPLPLPLFTPSPLTPTLATQHSLPSSTNSLLAALSTTTRLTAPAQAAHSRPAQAAPPQLFPSAMAMPTAPSLGHRLLSLSPPLPFLSTPFQQEFVSTASPSKRPAPAPDCLATAAKRPRVNPVI